MAKILVVDDDIVLAQSLKTLLEDENHTIDSANDGNAALEYLKTYDYDLIILDWQMPGCDGIEVCKRYRESGGNAYIIMLTGQSNIEFKEEGLDNGADDYIVKPFVARELFARVRALLRRPPQANTSTIKVGSLTVDMKGHDAFFEGKPLKLMPLELALLELALTHPNEIFTSESLMKRLWSADNEVGPESVYACITRLRKKLKACGLGDLIKTVHGAGYRFEVPNEAS